MTELPKSQYELMYSLEESFWWYVGMRETTRAIFSRLGIEKGSRLDILDVGSGTGFNQVFLAEYGESFGLEYSAEALKFHAMRQVENSVRADAVSMPFKDETFDLVCSFDVLEYVPYEASALKEALRVIRSGGLIFIREAAFEWLKGEHDRSSGIIRRYTRHSLASSLSQAGFRIIFSSYANFFLFPVIAGIRLFREHLLPARESSMSDVYLSPESLNEVLYIILRFESLLQRKLRMPFGSSVIVVGRKP